MSGEHSQTHRWPDWTETKTRADDCPGCGELLNASGAPGASCAPAVGDYSLCAYCGSFLRFDANMRRELLTIEDVAELPDQVRMQFLRMRRTLARARHKLGWRKHAAKP